MTHAVLRRLSAALALAGSLAGAACSPGAGGRVTPTVVPGAGALSAARALPAGIDRLGTYTIDPTKVFVAGISAGGFFGVQMHVAHAGTFKGAAIYAGGVYDCAQDSLTVALFDCGGLGLYASTLAASETYLDMQSSLGTIDPSRNLQGQPVYLWSGTQDATVKQAEMNDLSTEYAHYGARVTYDNTFPAAHGWESPDGELACGTQSSPYMIRCDAGGAAYDSEQTWLSLFLGRLKPRKDHGDGQLIRFDQSEFGAGAANSMDTTGYAFVPKRCAMGKPCALVVALHGCLQTQADIGTKFIDEGGIDPWADHNDIVVLYPYAVRSPVQPFNPQGCWDWWGYDDPQYALKSGTQVSIVYKMVERITGRP